MNKIFFLLVFFGILIIGCSKKHSDIEPVYTEEEFVKLTSDLTAINPTGENAIPFHEYSDSANHITSKVFKYERLRFYAIGFDSVEEAKKEAKRLNQYYSHNYMFDQVEGEPILEDLVITKFKAINPNRSVQRVPKKSEHGEHKSSEHAPAEHH